MVAAEEHVETYLHGMTKAGGMCCAKLSIGGVHSTRAKKSIEAVSSAHAKLSIEEGVPSARAKLSIEGRGYPVRMPN